MSNDLQFHHVGMLVDLIEKHSALYVERFGYELKSEIIHDPKQTAYVQFLAFPGQTVYIELVAPDAPNSFLSNALQKGGGLNHVCYSTVDIDAACDHLRSKKMVLLRPPTEAVAFDQRRIAWMKVGIISSLSWWSGIRETAVRIARGPGLANIDLAVRLRP